MSWGVATQNGVSVSLASVMSLSCGATEFSPASLFTSGVVGAWYDPSDVLLNWRTNLLTYSQEFDNAAWYRLNTTVTANTTIAPDGSTTADTVIIAAATANSDFAQNTTLAANVTATISCYAKFAGVQYLNMGYAYTGGVYAGYQFDLVNGVVVGGSANNGTNVSASITPVGNGWYRCVAVLILTYSAPSAAFLPSNVAYTSGNVWYNTPLTGNGTDGIYLWGAQLELGSTATTYQAITTPEQTYLTYDPQPVLYQDSAGTTPVTAVEQPVGLMLDKSQGLVLGSELVTNGDFSGGTTGWTAGNSATLSTTGGKLSVVNGAVSLGQGRQTITTVAGKTYKLSVTFTSVSASRGYVFVGTFAGDNSRFSAGPLTTSQTVTGYFTAAGTSTYLSIGNADNSIGLEVQFDDVTVKDIAGNHALQATSASRPILRARYNLLTYSEDYTNAIWTKGGTATAPSANSLTFPAVNDYVWQQLSPAASYAGKQVTGSVLLSGSGTVAIGYYDNVSAFQTDVITLTTTPTRYTVTKTIGAGAADVRFIVAGRIGAATATAATANQAQVVFGSSAGTYQRIAAATDYATAGFLPYLALDGTDDSFGTNSINFSGTDEVTVFAGVTKLSDAALGIVAELSATLGAGNPGSFFLTAPRTAATGDFAFNCGGTAFGTGAVSANSFAAPTTRVMTGVGDISGDVATLRIDGAQVATSATDQGTGNFGNYPLYIGRRNNTSLPFNGRIYQMVVCGKTLSASELASTEAYVATKTGVTI